MNKQKIYTATGIVLSFVIAIGGWTLTSTLISKKSDALLSMSGTTQIKVPSVISTTPPSTTGSNNPNTPSEPNGPSVPSEQIGLTEREIVSVLQNWESPGREFPHEPMAEQITMEQAIEIGKDGLIFFSNQNIIPAEYLAYDKTNAYLCQNQARGQSPQSFDPIYSYWTVSFTGESISAVFTINAVTGQIWKSDIRLLPIAIIDLSENTLEAALIVFMSNLEINSEHKINATDESVNLTVYKSFADGGAYAIIRTQSRPADNATALAGIKMYLSTQAP